jgi:hypothetical protein
MFAFVSKRITMKLQTLRNIDLAPPQLPRIVAVCKYRIIALESVGSGLSLGLTLPYIYSPTLTVRLSCARRQGRVFDMDIHSLFRLEPRVLSDALESFWT